MVSNRYRFVLRANCLVLRPVNLKTSIYLFALLLLSISGINVHAQKVDALYQGSDIDSSYYDIYQVAENDIWIGGEYGVLKRLKQDGSLSNISIPNNGSNILKFLRLGDFVYISADHGTIYKYNLKDSTCTKTEFPAFRHRCFYDLSYDNQGHLVVCGGSSGIGRGKKRIPNGFIATIDTSLAQQPQVIWKNTRKFVWALANEGESGFAAAVFNGVSTTIYHHNPNQSADLVKGRKVKGLIHALKSIDGQMAYSGCRSIRYHRSGIWGFENNPNSHTVVKNAGIICNLVQIKGRIYGFSQQGILYALNGNEAEEMLQASNASAFYEALLVGSETLYIAGHGKSLIKVTLD